jgi:hypothetical protein
MKHGIKETMELIDGLEVALVGVIGIAKDGFSLEQDLPKLLALAGEAQKLSDAVADVTKAKDELMDIDVEEAKQLVDRLYKMAGAIALVK